MSEEKIIVLLDSVNRTILGIIDEETELDISVKNPVIINAVPRQNGQMGLQLIPLFFRDILKDKNQDCIFTYPKNKIVKSNISNMEDQIIIEYKALFKPVPDISEPVLENDDKIIDLFGDKK